MSDYIDSIFDGVSILIDKKLENIAYDTTIICTITDNTDKKNGKYRVTDGSVSFIAYSDVSTYRNGEQVRVTVPQGDMTQKKYIVGKYSADEDSSPITYVSPLDSVINVSGNLFETGTISNQTDDNEFGIIANGADKSKIIWQNSFSAENFRDLQANGIYNIVILKADFKTLLHNYKYTSGTYGVRADLLIRPALDSDIIIRQTVELSNRDMFGNPYNFSIYVPQAKVVNISSIGIIEAAEISIYQNGDFKNDKNQYVQPVGDANNILISNIEFGFGGNLKDIDDNVVKIYPMDSLKYMNEPHSNETNLKRMGLIWYNKDENDKYIGYSDGVYDEDYDELQYLSLSNFDLDLINKKKEVTYTGPKDKFGLTLAVQADKAKKTFSEILEIVDDICNEYNTFLNRITQSGSFKNGLGNVITNLTSHGTLTGPVEDNIENLSKLYLNIFKYATLEDKSGEDVPSVTTDYYAAIKQGIENIINKANSNISGCPQGYQESYDNLKIRVKRFTDSIVALQTNITEEMTAALGAELSNYLNYLSQNKTYTEYGSEDFSDYDDKYSIYWYRFEEGYVDPSKMKLMPDGWRLLSNEELRHPNFSDIPYESLPSYQTYKDEAVLDEKNNKKYNIHLDEGKGFVYRYIDPNAQSEKYVALVCHNHNIYKSNELIFENSQEIKDPDLADKSDALNIEHLVNSSSSYPLYNEICYLKNSSEEFKPRELRCHYDGVQMQDEALIDANIYWYIPEDSTMITYNLEELKAKGFDTDAPYYAEGANPETDTPIRNLFSESKNGYICFYKKIAGTYNAEAETEEEIYNFSLDGKIYDDRSFWYKIKPYLIENEPYNHILCKVVPKDRRIDMQLMTSFNFSVAGNSGTPYTLEVKNTSTNQTALTTDNDLELVVELRDADNKIVKLDSSHALTVSWHAVLVEEGSTAIAPTITDNKITIHKQNASGILSITARVPYGDDGDTVTLKTLHSIPFASTGAKNWHLSGATQVIYNNLGALDQTSLYNGSYEMEDLDTHTGVSSIKWAITSYVADVTATLTHIDELDETIPNISFYTKYAPVLTPDKKLKPSPLYLNDSNYVPFIIGYTGSNLLNMTNYYMQPILIQQNAYPSKFLNDWNGLMDINNETGTIMSTMVGAGRKNNRNQFEGVLMGNVELGASIQSGTDYTAGALKTGLGLYGFHEGVQSFGFNIDGTAFIGTSGSGRIIFNGGAGIIASGNWFNKGRISSNGTITTQGEEGMCINLATGHIDAFNFKLTSSRINFNTHPSTSGYYMNIITKDNHYLRLGDTHGLEIYVDKLSIKSDSANQEAVFDTIFEGTQGIEIRDGKVYVSAEFIQAGLLKSQNFTLTQLTYTNGVPSAGSSVGMCIDLDNGALWTPKFQIDTNGSIHATDGYFKGIIDATAGGSLAGWNITANSISKSDTSSNLYTVNINSPTSATTNVINIGVTAGTGETSWPTSINASVGSAADDNSDDFVADTSIKSLRYVGNCSINARGHITAACYNNYLTIFSSQANRSFLMGTVGWKLPNEDNSIIRDTIMSAGGFVISANSGQNAMYLQARQLRFWVQSLVDTGGTLSILSGSGKIIISSSSQRYKENITTIFDDNINPNLLYKIPVKQFNFKEEYRTKTGFADTQVGLIAEDVAKYYPPACIFKFKTDIAETWEAKMLIPPMLKLIQDQKKEIDALWTKCLSLEEQLYNK